MKPTELKTLIDRLRALPKETEWVEFKRNNSNPTEIGECISALSNGAALHRQTMAYAVWGIDNDTHEVVGTDFKPHDRKIGNEELENWLLRTLCPRIGFRIFDGVLEGKRVVLLEIPPATHQPVGFSGTEYIRVGSYTKKLRDYPEKERALWAGFSDDAFEGRVAAASLPSQEVLQALDYASFFRLLGIPLPDNRRAILERLAAERIIVARGADSFDVTNVGAVLFATDLPSFPRLERKRPRVVIYRGSDRTETIREQDGRRGYAVGFEGLVSWINDQLPQNELINQALRQTVRTYPEVAVRELVANALIHQDFYITGTGPMIEVFSDRMEISNPGVPLLDPLRFIDEPPRSRNEYLGSLMRRMNVCEERGSGIDKVITAVEAFQLPAPDFRVTSQHTIAVLFGPREFAQMDRQDRIRACYQHACLMYVSGKQMTNSSLRVRMKIKKENYPMASRIIRDTIDDKLIRQAGGSRKDASYVPFWA